ncbi:MAG: hypothetical protein AMXMBFR23_11880 [Chloroflexota bacterium]
MTNAGEVSEAVRHFWETRNAQGARPSDTASRDAGRRAVTGGKQLDGFAGLIANAAAGAGVPDASVFWARRKELPGYFRATKEWDLLVVHERRLLAVIELKSQVGSFGNNLNNRVEESVGSAYDLTRAHREGAFGSESNPWLGYFFLLEERAGRSGSTHQLKVKEPHFPVFEEYQRASYAGRIEELCRRLVVDRLYNAAWFLLTKPDHSFREPNRQLSGAVFLASLQGHLTAQLKA